MQQRRWYLVRTFLLMPRPVNVRSTPCTLMAAPLLLLLLALLLLLLTLVAAARTCRRRPMSHG